MQLCSDKHTPEKKHLCGDGGRRKKGNDQICEGVKNMRAGEQGGGEKKGASSVETEGKWST